MIAKYIGGIIGLTKDAIRLMVYLLKRPHYVAVLLALFVGAFYINGVPPQEIGAVLSEKWQAFVENRKQTFKEDYQILSEHFANKKQPVGDESPEEEEILANLDSLSPQDLLSGPKKKPLPENRPSPEEIRRQMTEETFGWQQAFREAKEKPKNLPDENAVEGVLTVLGADRIKVDGKVFTLKMRVLPGKTGQAYQKMKRLFDGMYGQCIPDVDSPEKAECIVGSQEITETLADLGLAEQLR